MVIEFIRTTPHRAFPRMVARLAGDKALKARLHHHHRAVDGVFALRLVVQVPLYLADSVALLGMARLLMGIPFWALAIWVSYLIIATPMHRHRSGQRRTQRTGGKRRFDHRHRTTVKGE